MTAASRRTATLIQRAWPAAALLTAVAVTFARYLVSGRFLIEDDTLTQEYPILKNLFAHGTPFAMPRWSPEIFLGYPLLGSTEGHVFTPLNVLFLWLTPETGLPIRFMAFFLLSSGLMYLLLRTLGSGRAGALFGGVVWGMGAHAIFTQVEIRALATMAFFPGVLLCYTRFLRGGGLAWGVITALSLGVSLLGGHMQHAYAFALFLALYTPVLDRADGRALDRQWLLRRSASGVMIGALAVGLGAVTILPTFEILEGSVRAGMPVEYRLPGSVAVEHVPAVLFPRLAEAARVLLDYSAVGLLPVALAVLALCGRVALARGLFLLGASFLVLSLGESTPPTRWLLLHLPRYDFREPHRIGLMWTLSIAMLAGLGLHALLERRPAKRSSLLLLLAVLVAAGLGLRVLHDGFARAAMHQPALAVRVELVAAAAGLLLVVGLLLVPWLGTRPIGRGAAVALLLSLQLAPGVVSLNGSSPAPRPGQHPDAPLPARDVLVLERRQPDAAARPPVLPPDAQARVRARDEHGPVRTAVVSPRAGEGGYNFALMGSHQEPFGYLSLVPRRVMQLARKTRDVGVDNIMTAEFPVYRDARLLGMLNARYVVVLDPRTPRAAGIGEGLAPLLAGERVVVYENPSYLPRCFFAGAAEWAPDEDAALARVLSPDFHPTRSLLLEGAPGANARPSAAEAGIVPGRVTVYESERVVCELEAPSAGWAVLLDRHAPGWEVRVDGRTAEVLRADYLFRAVAVEAGASRIEHAYGGRGITLGSRVSLISLAVAALGLVAAERVRRQKRRRRTGA